MARQRLISTAHGTRADAFGPAEWALLAAPAIMWGSSFLLIAAALETTEPLLITLGRLMFGAVALAFFPRARGSVPREAWPRIILLAVTWMAIPLALFPIAQQWINSSITGMLNAAMPIFATLIAAALLKRLPGRMQAAGVVIGFLGVLLVSLPSLQLAGTAALGVFLIVLATAFYGLSVNIAVPVQQQYGGIPVIWRAQWIAILLSLPLGLASVPGSEFAWTSLAAVAALGVFGTGLAFIAMAELAGRVGATRASVAIYFIPIVAVALGVAVRGDEVEPVSLVGMVLVIIGAYLASRRERVPEPSPVLADA